MTSCMGNGLSWWIKQDGLGYVEVRNNETSVSHSWSVSRAVQQGSFVHYRHQKTQADRGPISKVASRIISTGRREPSKSWCSKLPPQQIQATSAHISFSTASHKNTPSFQGDREGQTYHKCGMRTGLSGSFSNDWHTLEERSSHKVQIIIQMSQIRKARLSLRTSSRSLSQ